jgi:hypothetical protein
MLLDLLEGLKTMVLSDVCIRELLMDKEVSEEYKETLN